MNKIVWHDAAFPEGSFWSELMDRYVEQTLGASWLDIIDRHVLQQKFKKEHWRDLVSHLKGQPSWSQQVDQVVEGSTSGTVLVGRWRPERLHGHRAKVCQDVKMLLLQEAATQVYQKPEANPLADLRYLLEHGADELAWLPAWVQRIPVSHPRYAEVFAWSWKTIAEHMGCRCLRKEYKDFILDWAMSLPLRHATPDGQTMMIFLKEDFLDSWLWSDMNGLDGNQQRREGTNYEIIQHAARWLTPKQEASPWMKHFFQHATTEERQSVIDFFFGRTNAAALAELQGLLSVAEIQTAKQGYYELTEVALNKIIAVLDVHAAWIKESLFLLGQAEGPLPGWCSTHPKGREWFETCLNVEELGRTLVEGDRRGKSADFLDKNRSYRLELLCSWFRHPIFQNKECMSGPIREIIMTSPSGFEQLRALWRGSELQQAWEASGEASAPPPRKRF